ncbi:MAG: pgk [Gammaproteobacteria bacterium]|jgi:phosphoglycerate kinase|nr:pgk [Gammaproteobacteria bacterium]
MLTLSDVSLQNKRVLIREDLNVPIENGKITSEVRLLAAIPTIEYCLHEGAAVMIASHLGRPEEGKADPALSLALVAEQLGHLLGHPVRFEVNWLDGVEVEPGEVVVLENVRFNPGEKKNDSILAKKMAALCDVFVMDAFATAHRAEASTAGVASFAPIACAGPLLMKELNALEKAFFDPRRPLLAIVGGSKVSSKLTVLESVINIADQLIVGGGIANTFLAAAGFNIGKSLYEPDLIPEAKRLMALAKGKGAMIPIPTDVVTAKEFSKDASPSHKKVEDIEADDMILDIGPETAAYFAELVQKSRAILWNGPVGVFEWDAFAEGTKVLAEAISNSQAFSVAGGGDTIAAIEKYDIADRVSYISTGGGAFLSLLEGKQLPGISALK